jgi:hypothetical protein
MTQHSDINPSDINHFDITWQERGGPPRMSANPDYPHGVDLDVRAPSEKAGPSCTVKLPYPTGKGVIGTWLVRCQRCGRAVGITAASRADDPRSAIVACKGMEGAA